MFEYRVSAPRPHSFGRHNKGAFTYGQGFAPCNPVKSGNYRDSDSQTHSGFRGAKTDCDNHRQKHRWKRHHDIHHTPNKEIHFPPEVAADKSDGTSDGEGQHYG